MRNIGLMIGAIIFVLCSCEGIIQYSPYDANAKERALNEKNIAAIKLYNPSDTLWFAALADVHYWYNELYDATWKINQLKNISFVAVCGDITDAGLAKEYEWYNRTMENLNVPYITIIGNHDYRSNGSVIYRKMFGPVNFKFEIGPYHFIGFDDVVWENNNSLPNFNWLNSNLADTLSSIEVVFAHIPPWSDQLELDSTELNQTIIRRTEHTLVIHGHEHSYSYHPLRVHHIVVGAVNDRVMCLIGLHGSSYTLKRISF